MAMQWRLDLPRKVDVIEIEVLDLDAVRTFYVWGLGWMASRDTGDLVSFDVGNGVALTFVRAEVARQGSPTRLSANGQVASMQALTLVMEVASDDEVMVVVDHACTVGAKLLQAPSPPTGGSFGDPAGLRWRVTTGLAR
jgi:hypothetical protein